MNPKITESELELFELLRQDKLKDYEVFSKKEYKNIFRGIIEKYPESAHFIYELIQNADDARATNVSIILYYDKLVFKHDGKKHFDVSERIFPLTETSSLAAFVLASAIVVVFISWNAETVISTESVNVP